MKRKTGILVFVLGAAFLFAASASAADLIARPTDQAPQLDGKPDALWSGAPKIVIPIYAGKPGRINVSMKALYDSQYIYFFIRWADKTKSLNRVYDFRGGAWQKRKGNEDRFGIMFDIGNRIADFNQAGCQIVCHGGKYMSTNKPGEKTDVWHWKSQRTNPLGYADDQWVQHEAKQKGHEFTGRKSDKKSGGSYKSNFDKIKKQPKFFDGGMGGPILKKNAKPYAGGAIEGAVAPREMLARPKGSRGDIDAKGVWKNGMWTLELRRKLDTGHPDDVVFVPGKKHAFGISVHDNGDDVDHSYSIGASQLILKK